MKKNIVTIFLIGILLLLPYNTEAYTVKKIDASGFTIEGNDEFIYEVKAEDYDFDESSVYIYIVKDEKTELSNVVLSNINSNNYKCKKNSYEKCLMKTDEDLSVTLDEKWLENDLYAYVLIVNNNEVSYTDKPVELTKIKNNIIEFQVQERYTFENKVTGNLNKKNNYLYVTSREELKAESIEVKIGIIHDADLLKQLKNNDENVYLNLIEYAKKDKKGENIELNLLNKKYIGDIQYLNVINGSYYYIYVEESKNVPEGIMFAQGRWRLLESEVIWPSKAMTTVALVMFAIDMTLPIIVLSYIFILSKKKDN